MKVEIRVSQKKQKGGAKKKQKETKKNVKVKLKPKKNQKPVTGGQDGNNDNVVTSTDTRLISLKKLEEDVLKYIVGQDEQVRKIATAIYRAITFSTIKSNILIIGNSGTGKTATIKQIADTLGLPYTIEDATKYTQEGYYGADVEEMVFNLIQNADNDYAKAWNGIIVIDEIDKKAASGDQHDVSGVEVLKSLLKIIEGTTVLVPPLDFMIDPIPFDTHDLIIIFMGAFPGLSKIRDVRLNRKSMGFSQAEPASKGSTNYIKQDLVKYGLPEEFVGRIDTIVEMNDLGIQELVQILKKSKLSILKKYEIEFKRLGIKLKYDDGLFEEIANESLVIDTGARELSNTVNYIFEKIVYDVLTNPGKYKKCVLLPGIVEDNTQYELS